MSAKSYISFASLDDIRDQVYLLSIGHAYLCDAPVLKKIGAAIDSRLDELREEILSLKKQFPGKFESEVDTEGILQELRDAARQLQKADDSGAGQDNVGALGEKLEKIVHSMTDAIRAVQTQVEGTGLKYTAKDAVLGLLKDRQPIPRRLSAAINPANVMKLLGLIFLLMIILFFSLFLTMEREGDLITATGLDEGAIRSRQKTVSELISQRDEMYKSIEAIKTDNMSRREKIDIMALSIEAHEVDERIQNLLVEIKRYEDRVRENQKKISQMEQKSFLRRLIRQ
ncbi:MAG: hypothetical protein ACOWYE_10750 [Desulfatiglandales bacterium]